MKRKGSPVKVKDLGTGMLGKAAEATKTSMDRRMCKAMGGRYCK